MLVISLLGSLCFLLTLGLTKALIDLSPRIGMLDEPNERSSHTHPVAKGGGLSFFLVFFLVTLVLKIFFPQYNEFVTPLMIGGPVVVALGWLDDKYSLSASLRLLIHIGTAVFIYALITQGFQVNLSISFLPDWPFVTEIFCILFVAWFINLYNFMDGADGLASTTAIAGSVLMAIVAYIHGAQEIAMLYCLMAYIVGGFLYFNWQPARIFMGDTGAYFLGFTFATLALVSKAYADISIYSHIIIFGFFIFDATYVLTLRVLRGEHPFKAHKTFTFHKLMAKGWSHRKISAFYTMVLVIWLFPISNMASIYSDYGLLLTAFAYVPLIGFGIYNRAGLTSYD